MVIGIVSNSTRIQMTIAVVIVIGGGENYGSSSRCSRVWRTGVLQIEEVETPAPGAGEVLLRVRAIGLNRTELTLRSGRSPVKPPLPSRIGSEAAGEIVALGPDVSGFSIGERVALVPTYGAAQYGLYGETSLAPARSLVKIPTGQTLTDAAATWVAFGAAWSGLIAVGQIKAKASQTER